MTKMTLHDRLGAVLGRSWGILEAILALKFALPYTRACAWWQITFLMLTSFPDAFWIELGRPWAPKRPKMTPSWGPKTTQNRSKIDTENSSHFGPIFDPFLGRSWVQPDSGSAAEAWAVPCTFRTEVPEISKKSNVTFFE